MKHLKTYKIFESSNVLDTVNDILIEVNDISGWEAYSWKKYEGDTLPKDDIVIILKRTGVFDSTDMNEWEIIKSMGIPSDVIDAITRLVDYMSGYKCNIFIGCDDDAPTGPVAELYEVDLKDRILKGKEGIVDRLWMDEFIRIEFTK